MKTLQLLGLLFLISCGSRTPEPQTQFSQIFPDNSKTWAGRMTSEAFHQTRNLEQKLNLRSISFGKKGEEIRIWTLSSFYDPQSLIILSKNETKSWYVRQVTFYHSKNDSIVKDITKPFEGFSSDEYWNLASQSDLKNGDAYGCFDGSNVSIEIANFSKYRFMWYRCPDINKDKDSSFYKVVELKSKIAEQILEM